MLWHLVECMSDYVAIAAVSSLVGCVVGALVAAGCAWMMGRR